jgi:hypothetical protein
MMREMTAEAAGAIATTATWPFSEYPEIIAKLVVM